MPQTSVPVLDKEQLARLGAKQLYAQLQEQIRALADAYPDIIEENDTPERERRRAHVLKQHKSQSQHEDSNGGNQQSLRDYSDALVNTIQATMPTHQALPLTAIYALVQSKGFRFRGGDEAAAVARALSKMARRKLVKHTGHSRASRYELLQKAG